MVNVRIYVTYKESVFDPQGDFCNTKLSESSDMAKS